MNFNFGDILTRAWNITWKHRALWLFGVLASCGTGRGFNIGGSSNFNLNSQDAPTGEAPQFLRDMGRFFTPENALSIVLILFGVLLVLSLIFTAISVIGRIGLIRGTAQADSGGAPALGELFSGGWPYFWRSFWMWAVIGIPSLFILLAILIGFLAGMLVILAAVTADEQVGRILVAVPLLLACACFIGIFGLVLGWVGQQAQMALVLEDLGIVASIKRGWQVFRANLATIILMTLLFGIIGWFASLVISLPLIVILVPTLGAFFVSTFSSGGEPSFTPLIIGGLAALCYVPVSLAAHGILTAFTQSAWTLTYVELTRQPEAPVVETNVQA